MSKKQKYPPSKVIAIDVDGTLQHNGNPNNKLIEWCRDRKSENYNLILWSARGEAHARKYAELFNVTEIFDTIISKPSYVVDDQGWGWIKYTKVIRTFDEQFKEDN